MIVLNDLFDYGPKIYQNTEYFKFSIDSILLAEFAKIKKNYKVLDMCTGNAPVPLILATKYKDIDIDAVEIQEEIASLAQRSIEENSFQNRIKLYNEDIKEYESTSEYDVILCNPPYFKNTTTSLKNYNNIKMIARHEMELTLDECICNAKRLLKSNGTFYLVHRIDRLLDTCKILDENKLGIRNVAFVFTKDNSCAEFFLIEASKCKKSDIKVRSLNIKDNKTYKDIFKER